MRIILSHGNLLRRWLLIVSTAPEILSEYSALSINLLNNQICLDNIDVSDE